jgi:DNA invertase Pin-like site-specific DNA recombinase
VVRPERRTRQPAADTARCHRAPQRGCDPRRVTKCPAERPSVLWVSFHEEDTTAGSLTQPEKLRAGIYARVSTVDQQPENQLADLRRYVAARGWEPVEYVDHGVSGSRESRPALDQMLRDARRRRIDAVICWKLDRLGRSLRHLIGTLEELDRLGVVFISLGEGIDLSTPAGRLQTAILAAIAQFERDRIVERVKAGLARARAQGKRLGRKPSAISDARFEAVAHLSLRDAAKQLGVSRSVVHRWRLSRNPGPGRTTFAPKQARSDDLAEDNGLSR